MPAEQKARSFWRPPLWKWGVVAALISASAVLRFAPRPPAEVELLPFSNTPPAWDGSYPYVVIGASRVMPKTSIELRQPTVRHDSPLNEFDIDVHTGRFILRQTDLFVPDVMPLVLTRTYIVWDHHSRAFGIGGNNPYDIAPTGTRFPYTYQDLNLEDGYQVHMPRISKGESYENAVFRHSESSSEFFGAQDAWNGNGWTFTFRDGRKFYFPEAYYAKSLAQGAATEMDDASGHRIQLKRDKVRNLQQLISPSGHTITFQYDSSDRIIEAADDAGHIRKYSYDHGGHVETVYDGTHVLYRFEYAPLMSSEEGYDPWLLTAVLDADWNIVLHNKYLWGRVSEQQLSDGEVFRYEYVLKEERCFRPRSPCPPVKRKSSCSRTGD